MHASMARVACWHTLIWAARQRRQGLQTRVRVVVGYSGEGVLASVARVWACVWASMLALLGGGGGRDFNLRVKTRACSRSSFSFVAVSKGAVQGVFSSFAWVAWRRRRMQLCSSVLLVGSRHFARWACSHPGACCRRQRKPGVGGACCVDVPSIGDDVPFIIVFSEVLSPGCLAVVQPLPYCNEQPVARCLRAGQVDFAFCGGGSDTGASQ